MAKKPVITGPEQGHERTRELGSLKSPALVALETLPYLTQRKIPCLKKNQTISE